MRPRLSLRRARPAIALIALGLPLAAGQANGQQAWPPQNAYGSPYGTPYSEPPNGYTQPQYGQPQYPQPEQYAQPQYGQPQYAPPQGYRQQPYAPPYADPDQQYPQPGYGQQQAGYEAQALNPDQLEQLVAPIALYPDALLAQILAASTYPAQVAAADQWLHGMESQGYGSPDQIAAGADTQTAWDPSVKSLTAFQQVLDMLAGNLQWTTSLGNAYYNQPEDVMQTVQVLRQRAEDAGNLQSTPQEPLTYDQGYIQLAPPSQQMVYVPTYDPWTVYGQPIAPYPGFSLLGALGSFFNSGLNGGAIRYGLGIALSAFGHTPWGFMGWGLNWLAHAVLFHQSDYFTHSTTVADWGLPHGGPRAYYGGSYSARAPAQYFGGVHREPEYERGPRGAQNFVQPAREFYGTRGNEQYNPGYRDPRQNSVHPAFPEQQAHNRAQPAIPRAQAYANRTEPYRNQPDAYGRSDYRSRPAPNYQRGNEDSRRAYSGYGNSYAQEQRSGGFHLFGHGRDSENFASERAPKSFYKEDRAPRSYGREKMPKMPKERAPKYHSSGHGSSHRRR